MEFTEKFYGKKFNANHICKYFKNQPQNKDLKSPFTDDFFPPNTNSLTGLNSKNQPLAPEIYNREIKNFKAEKISWMRASEIFQKQEIKIFLDKIEFDDTKQGGLGNCYFISAVSALTEFPHLIKNIFKIQKINPAGYYEIAFFLDGYWQIVIIDDYFPVKKNTNQFYFAKPNGNELWVALLEKAWAKVNGGYLNIIGGNSIEALSALTGFPKRRVKIDEKLDLENLWEIVLNADKKGNIMCAGTKNEKDIEDEKINLAAGHAYTLISAKETVYKGERIRLVKIRNPWGALEWKGNWADDCPLWNDELKKIFWDKNIDLDDNYKKKNNYNDDGTFFMSIEDFANFFASLDVSFSIYNGNVKIIDIEVPVKEINVGKKPKNINENTINFPNVILLELKEPAEMLISVNNPYFRFNYDTNIITENPTSLILAKYLPESDRVEYMDGAFSTNDTEISVSLKKGYYILCTIKNKISNIFKLPLKNSYRVKFISDKSYKVINLGDDISFHILRRIISDGVMEENKEQLEQDQYLVTGDNSFRNSGLGYFIIVNSNEKMHMNLTLDFEKIQNFKNLPPHHLKNSQHRVICRPNSSFLSLGMRIQEYGDYWYNIDIVDNSYAFKKFDDDNGEFSDENADIFLFFKLKNFDIKNIKKEFERVKISENYFNYVTLDSDEVNLNNSADNSHDEDHETEKLNTKNINVKEFIKNLNKKNTVKNDKENKETENVNSNKGKSQVNKIIQKKDNFNENNEKIDSFDEKVNLSKNKENLKKKEKKIQDNSSEPINNDNNINNLRKEFPQIFDMILKIDPIMIPEEEKSLIWKKTNLPNGVYIGQHNQSDYRYGRGAYVYSDNSFFIGNFINGLREGKVFEYNQDFSLSFEGYYKDGKRNGKGIINYKNGNKYIGEFCNDMKNGSGVYQFDKKRKWEGNFIDDEMHGEGFYTDEKNEVFLVKFDNGKQVLN